jgi:hypothetical protein
MPFLKYNVAFLKITDFKTVVNLKSCEYLNVCERTHEEEQNHIRRFIRKLSSTLKKRAIYSEMFTPFYQKPWHHIPEYS